MSKTKKKAETVSGSLGAASGHDEPARVANGMHDFRSKVVLDEGQGGLGKAICMTAVAKAIKDEHPDCDLIVRTSYPDTCKGLPFIDAFYGMEPRPYMRKEIADAEYIRTEPYLDLAWRQGKEHLISTWCRLVGVRPPREIRGIIELTEQERQDAETLLGRVDRPIVALQWIGGTSNQNPGAANALGKLSQARHLKQPVAQEIVNHLVKEGLAVLQISLPTEPRLQNVLYLDEKSVTPTRLLFALLERCNGLIGIDSFAQHAWAALGKKDAVVLWGYSNPTNYGYACNNNLTATTKKCRTPHCNRPETHLGDILGNGEPWVCPHGGECMAFDPKIVADAAIKAVRESMPKPQPAEPEKKAV